MAGLSMLGAICKLAEKRDSDVGGHLDRMARYTGQLAHHAGIDDSWMFVLAARTHDIGKVGIADGILFKPGPLLEEEFAVMKLHAQFGWDVLSPLKELKFHRMVDIAADIAYCHHEHWDGGGYPRGLSGEDIPIAARCAALGDCWDAVTTNRVYRRALWPDAARLVISSGAGKQFDPFLAEKFLELIDAGKL